MRAIVFAGPSLYGNRRALPPMVTLRPPAAQGDVYRVVQEKPQAIGIIDGYFEGVPSVWHKEILYALENGIAVLGAASMGALRAAELDRFGMIGIGQIYAWYRDGTIEDDSEVAVLHGPAETSYMPLSEPLVNIRATLAALCTEGELNSADAAQLLEAARSIHYTERTVELLLARAAMPDLAEVFAAGRVNLKQRDALELIEALGQEPACPGDQAWKLERTLLWERAVAVWDATVQTPGAAALDELRILDPRAFAEMRLVALQRHLLLLQARQRGLTADRPARLRALDRLRSRFGLQQRSELDRWLTGNQLDPPMLDELMSEEALTEQAAAVQERASISEQMVRLLKLSGRYGDLATRAALKAQSLSNSAALAQSPPPPLLLSWYSKRLRGAALSNLDKLVADLGLENRQAFYRLLAREYLYLQKTASQHSDTP
jgi:hypothetical protein